MALGVSSPPCLGFGFFSGVFFGCTLCVSPPMSPLGAARGAGSTPALGLFHSQLGKTNSAPRLGQCWERSLFPPGAGAAPELCLLLVGVAFLSLWLHLQQLEQLWCCCSSGRAGREGVPAAATARLARDRPTLGASWSLWPCWGVPPELSQGLIPGRCWWFWGFSTAAAAE